jgi:hypothetical protein
MKTTAMTLMILQIGALAYGRSEPSATGHTVTVCMAPGAISGLTMERAKMLASKMFGEIDVVIDWQQSSRSCPAEAILVSLSAVTPTALKPGALAYALPFEGRHIQVFYDRIESVCRGPMMEIVLAHVLVHEITHILEGVDRHSDQGVMKAKWDRTDFYHMKQSLLGFAPEDVRLIHLGLAERRKLGLLAMNTDQSSAAMLR